MKKLLCSLVLITSALIGKAQRPTLHFANELPATAPSFAFQLTANTGMSCGAVYTGPSTPWPAGSGGIYTVGATSWFPTPPPGALTNMNGYYLTLDPGGPMEETIFVTMCGITSGPSTITFPIAGLSFTLIRGTNATAYISHLRY